ncbi:alpha/beta fold hydrolase [Candidatus Cyanaurora vandensis]|uniref:alpha/beta fold hydrolase n=1 Tax=Candidatus Cyanaurora vandensis TaxID=2714958 RepID=UPI00257F0255|nr:alpha/beta hydrolase [Candidatus Cyanaurora vandensis]
MHPAFLPAQVAQLTEPAAIKLVERIQRQSIVTPLIAQPIPTSYVQAGAGEPPILLLHGFDSSLLEFRRLFPLLAQQRSTWAVDMVGFGFTQRLRGILYSPKAIRTHLYHFWQTLIRQPVVLVGTSMGGGAAIDFALTYPECVAQLVLMDSVGYTSGVPPAVRYLFPPFDYLAVQVLRSPRLRQRVSVLSYHNPALATVDAARCGALPLFMPGWYQASILFMKSGGYENLAGRIPQLTPPTLILWGEQDRILDPAQAQLFQKAIPKARLHWIKNCGHVPHLEQPQQTADHILVIPEDLER